LCKNVYTNIAYVIIVCTLIITKEQFAVKDKNINIRVTAEQHQRIMREARKLGLTVSAYILMLAEGASK